MNIKKAFWAKIMAASTLGIACISTSIVMLDRSSKEQTPAKAADATSYYSSADTSSAAKLYSSLVSIESSGGTSSYANLWTIYKTAYLKSDGTIKDYYSDSTSFTPGTSQCGTYSAEGGCYNREHSIPKSWWGGAETNQGADPFIVVPTDGYVNNKRSNYPLGEVSSATYTSNSGCKLGTGKMGSYSGTVFEPMDSVKGDLARIVFYSRVRWPSVAMNSGDGTNVFSGSQSTNYGLTANAVTMFTKWSAEDPVDDWEMSVNDAIFSSSTYGNRNPFIDHPEWVNTLWGGTTYSSGSSSGGSTTTATITLDKTSASVAVGSTITLKATTSDSSKVSWSVSNGYASLSSSSTSSGSTVTLTGVTAGSVTVYAQSATNSSVKASCAVTVTSSGSSSGGDSSSTDTTSGSATYTVSSTSAVTTSGTTPSGSSATYTQTYATASQITSGNSATLTLSGYGGKKITGITLNMKSNASKGAGSFTAVAGSTTISSQSAANFNSWFSNSAYSSSYVDVVATMSNSSYTIGSSENVVLTITGTTNSLYINSYTITYETASSSSSTVSVTGVSLNKTSLSLTAGNTATLTATVSPSNATNTAVTWSTSNSSVATVSSGTVTAVAAGTATITVKTSDGSYTATCSVTVTAATVSTTGISLDKSTASVVVGNTTTLTATVTPSNATNKSVTFSTSNSSVATVSSTSGTSGTAITITGVAAGTATITAKDSSGSYSATCTVTVTAATISVTGVTLSASSLSLDLNGTKTGTLTATVSPSNATNTAVTWSTSNSSIATVSNGTVTAVAVGSATITVTTSDGSYTATCTVTVTNSGSSSGGSTTTTTTTGTITFATNDSDSSTELTASTYAAQISEGASYISSATDISKAYAGKSGLKFGSKSAVGTITFTMSDTFQAKKVKSIAVTTAQYGSDTGNMLVYVNDSSDASLTITPSSATSGTYTLSSATTVTTLKFATSSKRAYLSSITVTFEETTSSTTYTADGFAQDLLDGITCDGTGSAAPTYNKSWSDLKALYETLSSDEQSKLINATYSVSGSGTSTVVTATGTSTTVVAQAMYRYDYIVAKYGNEAFISGRTSSANPAINLVKNNNTVAIVLLTIGLTSLVSVAYILIRKKKYE